MLQRSGRARSSSSSSTLSELFRCFLSKKDILLKKDFLDFSGFGFGFGFGVRIGVGVVRFRVVGVESTFSWFSSTFEAMFTVRNLRHNLMSYANTVVAGSPYTRHP